MLTGGKICFTIDSPSGVIGARRHRFVSPAQQNSWATAIRAYSGTVSLPPMAVLESILRDHLPRPAKKRQSPDQDPSVTGRTSSSTPNVNAYPSPQQPQIPQFYPFLPQMWHPPYFQQQQEQDIRPRKGVVERMESSPVRSDTNPAETLTSFPGALKKKSAFAKVIEALDRIRSLLITEHVDVGGIKPVDIKRWTDTWEFLFGSSQAYHSRDTPMEASQSIKNSRMGLDRDTRGT